jgi:hypothetical protein
MPERGLAEQSVPRGRSTGEAQSLPCRVKSCTGKERIVSPLVAPQGDSRTYSDDRRCDPFGSVQSDALPVRGLRPLRGSLARLLADAMRGIPQAALSGKGRYCHAGAKIALSHVTTPASRSSPVGACGKSTCTPGAVADLLGARVIARSPLRRCWPGSSRPPHPAGFLPSRLLRTRFQYRRCCRRRRFPE